MPILNAWSPTYSRRRGRRRSGVRLLIGQPAHLRFMTGLEQSAVVEDLCAGGACLRAPVRLRPGDHLGLRVNLGIGYKFDFRARVVHNIPVPRGMHQRYGLRFVALKQEDEHRLLQYLECQQAGLRAGVRALHAEY
jgi:hypothetical protein